MTTEAIFPAAVLALVSRIFAAGLDAFPAALTTGARTARVVNNAGRGLDVASTPYGYTVTWENGEHVGTAGNFALLVELLKMHGAVEPMDPAADPVAEYRA